MLRSSLRKTRYIAAAIGSTRATSHTLYERLAEALQHADLRDARTAALRRVAVAEGHTRAGATVALPRRDELAWVERIESVRAALEGSSHHLRVADRRLTVAEFSRRASKSAVWGLLLLRLVRALRPERCIELGTGVGLSGAYIAAGLELARAGRLTTIDGNAECVAIAKRVFAHLDLTSRTRVVHGRFTQVLDAVPGRPPVADFAFVDGHHLEGPTLRYVERLARSQGIIVIDDIRWSPGMRRAWLALMDDRRVALAADLGGVGLLLPAPS